MAEERLAYERLTTLWSVLTFHAEQGPDRIATKFEGRETSYRGLHNWALALASDLVRQGLGPGDRIGYLGKNSDAYFALLFAVARIGAVLVPLNWRLADEELAFIVRDSTMRHLFTDVAFLDNARSLADDMGLTLARLGERAPQGGLSLPLQDLPPEPAPDDIAFQVYTSGTTGHPKGAMLTHANMLALRAPGYRAGLEWFPTAGSTLGGVLPVAHIAGTAYACFGFYAGARVVISREFDPGETLELIEGEGINHILFAPAVMRMVMEHPLAQATDFASLQFITYGAAPIPEALLRDALAMFGCGFVQMYGMSEAAGGVVALTPEDHVSNEGDRLRSAGRAMPGVEVGIVDEDWTLLPPGETGEIVIRSGSVMTGYWNRPEASAEVLGPDGWFRTGDIGSIDGDGYVYVLDRAKDMIISGGENVYPAEVENAIFGHPDIVDVAVIGIPSDEWGEEVAAIIVPAPGADVTREAINHWLAGKIARFKFPKQVHLVKEIPRNAGGKILRRVLREPYWQDRRRRIN
ncbi:MAG: long-chain-fatty-acid--CoA ligase [Sphingomonadales bacterium]|nr:MAG: long-chain-fatty-acid--CoA ligase [Sphingomonadales bacterium]